jgi:hypothetical protein
LAHRAKGYLIHSGELYRRNASNILQQCVPIEEGKALLLDIHEGSVDIMLRGEAWSKRLSGKVFTGRQRHGANREILQRMLVLREANPLSGLGASDHPHYMDVCHMGPRLLGAIQESS